MRNGMLVGFVPEIEGSDSYTEEQIIDTIVRADYDKPIATLRPKAPQPAPALRSRAGFSAGSWTGSATSKPETLPPGARRMTVEEVVRLYLPRRCS